MTSKSGKAESSEPREGRANSLDHDEQLPTYEDSTPGPSTLQIRSTNSSVTSPISQTGSSPFSFPSTSELPPPEYTSPRPITILRQLPQATAPFLPAYAPILLNHGIPANTWYNFTNTMSAFLTVKVGKQDVSHTGDVAASIGRVPKNLEKMSRIT